MNMQKKAIQEKISFIELTLGGSEAAATAAGVSKNSWYRWATGRVDLVASKDKRSLKVIDLLWEKCKRESA